MSKIHPAIQEELDMLRERFPGKQELNLNDYAAYFEIDRHYASQHFSRINSGKRKIAHKRIGKTILIPFVDFAYWLASHKLDVNGKPIVITTQEEIKVAMKSRGGFSSTSVHNYRRLG